MPILSELIERLADDPKARLPREDLRSAAREIMGGGLPNGLIGGFLAAMRVHGEKGDEISAFVEVMLENATHFPRPENVDVLVDTCGTGGDGHNTFNISTAAALVTAAAGVPVAKHGNRSASSKCGSADVLEAVGYRLDLTPQQAATNLSKHKFCFLFARNYHGSMRHAAGARQELGIRTLFNVCGPLSNPARPTHQLVGVSSRALMEPVAKGLRNLGTQGALVVHGGDGMDEISLTQVTEGIRIDSNGDFHSWQISPHDFHLKPVEMADLVGGDAAANAAILRDVLRGQEGSFADIVCLNTAAVLWLTGSESSMEQGFARARHVQRSGAAAQLLESLLEDQRNLPKATGA